MYFETKVQARSKEELARRVADNELRGFTVARYYEYETEGTYAENTMYRSVAGTNQRHKASSAHKFYGAVMRKENRDRVAQ